MKKLAVVVFFSFLGVFLFAQKSDEVPPATRTLAITGATIIPEPGKKLEGATLLIRDGLIEEVGTQVAIPPDARIIEADSMFIYPGFISGLSHAGMPSSRGQEEDDEERPKVDDPGDPPNELAGIQPQRRLVDLLDPAEKSLDEYRKAGFTAAQVMPEGRMLPGTAGLILLHGHTPGEMLVREETALAAQLRGARRMYPATVIGVMTKFRELYRQAEQAMQHEVKYASKPAGLKRPVKDPVLQALYPVVERRLPVVFVAEEVKDVHRVLALQKDLGFELALAEVKQGWHLADELAAGKWPLFLSLDLPEEPKSQTKKAKQDTILTESGDTTLVSSEDPEKKALEKRRAEAMERHLEQAATLHQRGIPFGFATVETKPKDVAENLRRYVASGLPEETALAALTTQAADFLEVSAIMGTLEKGKLGNAVVWTQSMFEEDARVRYVLVEGQLYEYEVRKKGKKGDPDAVVALAGTWSYAMDIPGQPMEGTIKLTDDGGAVSGEISNPMTGEMRPLEGVSLDGNNLRFEFAVDAGGQNITVSYDLIFEGEYFEGEVEAGQFGVFPVEGERIGEPE